MNQEKALKASKRLRDSSNCLKDHVRQVSRNREAKTEGELKTVNIHEAKTTLSSLLAEVEKPVNGFLYAVTASPWRTLFLTKAGIVLSRTLS